MFLVPSLKRLGRGPWLGHLTLYQGRNYWSFQSDHAFYESLGKWAAIYGTLDEGRFNISSDFVRIPSNTWVSLPEKCEVSLGRNILHLGITTHTGERAGKIDAVHLTRLSNFREHEYMYLVERITIGGDRRSIIQLRGLDNLDTVMIHHSNSYLKS